MHAQQPDCNWLTKSTNGFANEVIQEMSIDEDGNILIAGWYSGNFSLGSLPAQRLNPWSQGNAYIAKLSPSGDPIWLNRIGGDSASYVNINSLSTDYIGNVYFTGDAYVKTSADSLIIGENFSIRTGDSTQMSVLVKMKPDGEVIWAQNLMTSSEGECNSVKVECTINDEIYISGYMNGNLRLDGFLLEPIQSDAVFVAKANKDGKYLWAQNIGSKIITGKKTEIVSNTNGEVFLSGSWEGDTLFVGNRSLVNPTPGGFGNLDRFISKFDSAGKLQWLNREGGTKTDEASLLAAMDDGSVYSLGSIATSADINKNTIKIQGPTQLLSQYGIDGEYIFHKAISSNTRSTDFKSDGSALYLSWQYGIEGVTIGPYTKENSSNIGDDAIVAKVDLNGNLIWTMVFGNYFSETISTIGVTQNSRLLIAGFSFSDSLYFGSKLFVNTRLGYEDFFLASFESDLATLPNIDQDKIILYPNPANDLVYLSLPQGTGQFTISVIDGFGRRTQVPFILSNNKAILDISHLSQGMYCLYIDIDNKIISKKIIKQ
jgi:hypothetical protein